MEAVDIEGCRADDVYAIEFGFCTSFWSSPQPSESFDICNSLHPQAHIMTAAAVLNSSPVQGLYYGMYHLKFRRTG